MTFPPPPPPGLPPQGPGYPSGPAYGGPFGAPVPPKAPGMAVAALVLGILGVTIGLCLWFFPVMPILAVIFGHISLAKINSQTLPGRGMAITGIVTGYVGLALAAVWLILVLFGAFSSPTPRF